MRAEIRVRRRVRLRKSWRILVQSDSEVDMLNKTGILGGSRRAVLHCRGSFGHVCMMGM